MERERVRGTPGSDKNAKQKAKYANQNTKYAKRKQTESHKNQASSTPVKTPSIQKSMKNANKKTLSTSTGKI